MDGEERRGEERRLKGDGVLIRGIQREFQRIFLKKIIVNCAYDVNFYLFLKIR